MAMVLMLICPWPGIPICRLACMKKRDRHDVEPAEHQRKEADDDVRDRRREIDSQLFLRDGEDVTHWAGSSAFTVGFLLGLFFGRQAEEDFFQAHARRPQLEQAPVVRDDRAREIAPDVAAPARC